MKNQLITAGIVLMSFAIILSGCTSVRTDEEKILGKWLSGEAPDVGSDTLIWNFFSNGSFSLNLTEAGIENSSITWMTYEIMDGALILTLPDVKVSLDYSFSNDGNALTLLDKENGSPTTLVRL